MSNVVHNFYSGETYIGDTEEECLNALLSERYIKRGTIIELYRKMSARHSSKDIIERVFEENNDFAMYRYEQCSKTVEQKLKDSKCLYDYKLITTHIDRSFLNKWVQPYNGSYMNNWVGAICFINNTGNSVYSINFEIANSIEEIDIGGNKNRMRNKIALMVTKEKVI